MGQNTIKIEEVSDPVESTRFRAQDEQAQRNMAWLREHWSEIVPKARGKFLAVAGNEAFIGETPQEAWSKAKAAHPEDAGALSQFVRTEQGPRIYGNPR